MSPQADLDQRVERLEQILDRIIELASGHPVGRKILARLGL